MSEQQYPALWQFLGAYLHQDWREEYESPSAALRDFVSGDPGYAGDLPTEIEQVLTSTADDAALEETLVDLGGFFVPSLTGQNPRAWLRRLRDETQVLLGADDSRFLTDVRALLAGTQSGQVALAEFEPRFLHLNAEMPLSTPKSSAEAIEDLFWVVEGFVAEPTLRTASDPDEHTLLEAIGTCLTRIGSDRMENLEHLIGAYFHQDWNHVYATRHEAVADFVRRSPDRAASVPREIDELLGSTGDDAELASWLSAIGLDDAPPDGDRAFLTELRDRVLRHGPPG